MTDLVRICNMALNRIGARASISSLAEVSTEAAACASMLDEARDATLRAHDWNFARRIVTLASLGAGPSNWAYAYAYPSDAVRVLGVVPEGGAWVLPLGAPPSFGTGGSTSLGGGERREIYSNLSPAICAYTRQVTDPTQWDSQFVTALTWQLGMEIAMPITGDTAKVSMCEQMFNAALAEARAQDANEHGATRQAEASWLRARGPTYCEDEFRGLTVAP
jgi:hypothetical protein